MERILSNNRHAVWNGDAGKVVAISERKISNTRDTVGDGDAGHGVVEVAEDGRPTIPNLNDSHPVQFGWDYHFPAIT